MVVEERKRILALSEERISRTDKARLVTAVRVITYLPRQSGRVW